MKVSKMKSTELRDQFGRSINYMRISITDRCNYRCVYCMPEEGIQSVPHEEILNFEEILRFCRLATEKGISHYKVTGGEPLCRKGALTFIKTLKNLAGVEELTLTTNGSYLLRDAEKLADTGIDTLTVSLDTINPEHYGKLVRNSIPLEKILQGIEKAKDLGLKIKINAVPMYGYNENDLEELTAYALNNDFHIRFIELMPVGKAYEYKAPSPDEIKARLEEIYGNFEPVQKKMGNGPAKYFTVPGQKGAVGFISALSHKFCSSCNRIRLTSVGFLKTCLYHNVGTEMKPLLRGKASDEEITKAIQKAIYHKPRAHNFDAEERDSDRFFMSSIGG